MIILKTIMKFYGCKVVKLSEYGIREGYLIENVINNKDEHKKDDSSKEDTHIKEKSHTLISDQNVVKNKENIKIKEKHKDSLIVKNDSIDDSRFKDSVINHETDKAKEVIDKKK